MIEDQIIPIALAGMLAQEVRRRVEHGGDATLAFDRLLDLVDAHGLNSAAVAAYLTGLLKR